MGRAGVSCSPTVRGQGFRKGDCSLFGPRTYAGQRCQMIASVLQQVTNRAVRIAQEPE